MTIYHYDNETGEYTGNSEAKESPLEPGVFLIPANATSVKVPTVPAGKVAVFDNGAWTLPDDKRGTTYWSDYDTEVTIDAIGETVPAGTILTRPPEPLDRVQARQISVLSSACEAAITGGFVSAALGTDHTYQSERDDHINLMGKVQMGVAGNFKCSADDGVTWSMQMHTAAQLTQVLIDGATHKEDKIVKFQTLKAQVEAVFVSATEGDGGAVDEAAAKAQVEAIVW
jgi:hypothetical protein